MPCPYCGSSMPGTKRAHCGSRSCFTAWNRARGATYRASGPLEQCYVCTGCGSEFRREPVRGQRPRWCPNCSNGRGWRRANLDKRRMADHRRRVLLVNGEVEAFQEIEIFERDRRRCGICRKRVRKDLVFPHPYSPSLDHIIPVVEGGHHVRANVRLTHLRCNLSKGPRGGNEQLLLIG